MQDVDRWVIEHALAELAMYRRKRPDLTYFVNIAGSAFADGTFTGFVTEQLTRQNLPASALGARNHREGCHRQFFGSCRPDRRAGGTRLCVAVDDFGTGYSSLSYLKRLPAEYIKIDGAFIRKLTESEVDESIVRAIAQIARVMGKRTIAGICRQ